MRNNNKNYNNQLGLTLFRFALLVAGWAGIGLNIYLKLDNAQGKYTVLSSMIDLFSFFTIQSNLLVVLWFTYAVYTAITKGTVLCKNTPYKSALALYIFATFSLYSVLLHRVWNPQGLTLVGSILTHYVVPLGFLIDWLYTEITCCHQQIYSYTLAVKWMIYPLLYGVYAVFYGKITGHYLYPFFNIDKVGVTQVVINFILLTVVFVFAGVIFIGISRALQSRCHPGEE